MLNVGIGSGTKKIAGTLQMRKAVFHWALLLSEHSSINFRVRLEHSEQPFEKRHFSIMTTSVSSPENAIRNTMR